MVGAPGFTRIRLGTQGPGFLFSPCGCRTRLKPTLQLELPLPLPSGLLATNVWLSASPGVARLFLEGIFPRGWKGESHRGGNRALVGLQLKAECSRHKIFSSLKPPDEPCSYLFPYHFFPSPPFLILFSVKGA